MQKKFMFVASSVLVIGVVISAWVLLPARVPAAANAVADAAVSARIRQAELREEKMLERGQRTTVLVPYSAERQEALKRARLSELNERFYPSSADARVPSAATQRLYRLNEQLYPSVVNTWPNATRTHLWLIEQDLNASDAAMSNASGSRDNITERSLESQDQLAALRAATAQFHQTDAAKAAGYSLVNGLDDCFNNPGVGGMGFHLIKTSSVDLALNALRPEAMVYVPGPNGQFQLGAVEYIVPADAWDAAGNTQPPSVLGRSLHLNQALRIYVLHAWIWQDNPSGIFQDWNATVACG